MTRIDACLCGDAPTDAAEFGARRAAWLRDTAYPGPHKAKRIERDFNVSESTAKRWLAGELPTREQLERELRLWGPVYAQFVFAPGLGSAPAIGAPVLRLVDSGGAWHAGTKPTAPLRAVAGGAR